MDKVDEGGVIIIIISSSIINEKMVTMTRMQYNYYQFFTKSMLMIYRKLNLTL